MKAFISYSSKDNDRFVKKFVEKIRDSHIEVWKDNLENINVDLANIIEEIYKVDIFIVIISENSVNSNWVKEEIKVAMARKIEEDLRIFPVVLSEDNVDVPLVLRHLIRYYIDDVNNYDDKFNELVEDIFDISKKSELGDSPNYASFHSISSYSKSDSIVLKCLGDEIINKNVKFMDFDGVVNLVKKYDLSDDSVQDSLEILYNRNLITYKTYSSSIHPYYIILTPFGFITYAENYMETSNDLIKEISSEIVQGNCSIESIVNKINISRSFVELYFKYLEMMHYVKLYSVSGGESTIVNIYAEGKRYFKELLS